MVTKTISKGSKKVAGQLKLSQTRKEVHLSTQSAFTPARSYGEHYPRVLFEQDNQLQNPRQDFHRFLPGNTQNHLRQSKQYAIPRQECTRQRIRDQV